MIQNADFLQTAGRSRSFGTTYGLVLPVRPRNVSQESPGPRKGKKVPREYLKHQNHILLLFLYQRNYPLWICPSKIAKPPLYLHFSTYLSQVPRSDVAMCKLKISAWFLNDSFHCHYTISQKNVI